MEGICAGKHSVAEYLVQRHGFQRLRLAGAPYPTINGSQDDELRLKGTSLELGSDSGPLTFPTVEDMLEFVTPRWRQSWVTTDIWDVSTLERLLLRPFFLLVSVDAPVSLRWKRFRDRYVLRNRTRLQIRCLTYWIRCWERKLEPPDLEKFVLWNDQHLYDRELGRASLTDRAQVRLFNSLSSLGELHNALDIIDIPNEQRLRPSWDQYFMQLASLAARRSNCMKRQVGCVLVREGRVISTGYNGTPRNTKNCNEGGCTSYQPFYFKKTQANFLKGARCNSGQGSGAALSTCLCIHAEENALLEAGRERIREGATLYCNT